jgi:AcrR family transcriptional regulator
VTTDDIAREANVSKATIYRYYKNKQEVFRDVVKLEADQLLKAIKTGVDKEKTVGAKFKSHLLTKMSTIRELINFYEVTQQSDDYYWPFVAEARAQFIQEEKDIVKGILEAGNRSKEIHVENTDLVAHMMVVSLQAQEYAWAIETLNISLEEYVNLMIDVVINGIKNRELAK